MGARTTAHTGGGVPRARAGAHRAVRFRMPVRNASEIVWWDADVPRPAPRPGTDGLTSEDR
ncbi:hypothetical protein AC230_09280 [Streptomyces caatingaensis]|uniref:Uncharacterized protein n=1 Tax=Streptomyces caatingaensis TaxID=1678637 RepID=A0A0K9XHE5_9ACTN|nr:hypothetical protein AC230_09280 [Streptomyces caatingaensis]